MVQNCPENNTVSLGADPHVLGVPDEGTLRIIPLGGLGEIGKNMLVFQSTRDIVVVDAGFAFPEEHMLGVDLVIPDISYLMENANLVRGIFLTHGHEDHTGALPYILSRLKVPIYGTRLTLGIVKSNLREFDLADEVEFRAFEPGGRIELGSFQIESFRVIHSISEGVGLAIHTPPGTVVHSGDFKFDVAPIDGVMTDFNRLSYLGEKGVLLLLSDSTRADKPGHSDSELLVAQRLLHVFGKCLGRIIVCTFASSIPRIQQVINISMDLRRRICFLGKSLVGIVQVASELGYLSVPGEMVAKPEEIPEIPDERLVILTTGSQGEPLSVLTLIAGGNHKWVKIKPGDTVIISASPVPGNETLITRTVNSLFRLGAEVIYEAASGEEIMESPFRIHVSGHASREELRLLIGLLRPRFFVPIHGEYRHLVHHARLARGMGIPEKNILIIEDGDILEVTAREARVVGRAPAGDILVDGKAVGDVGRVVLRDRRAIGSDGIAFVVATLDEYTRDILAGPEVISRGFVYVPEADEMLRGARKIAKDVLAELKIQKVTELRTIKEALRLQLSQYFSSQTGRKPMIVPVIMEV